MSFWSAFGFADSRSVARTMSERPLNAQRRTVEKPWDRVTAAKANATSAQTRRDKESKLEAQRTATQSRAQAEKATVERPARDQQSRETRAPEGKKSTKPKGSVQYMPYDKYAKSFGRFTVGDRRARHARSASPDKQPSKDKPRSPSPQRRPSKESVKSSNSDSRRSSREAHARTTDTTAAPKPPPASPRRSPPKATQAKAPPRPSAPAGTSGATAPSPKASFFKFDFPTAPPPGPAAPSKKPSFFTFDRAPPKATRAAPPPKYSGTPEFSDRRKRRAGTEPRPESAGSSQTKPPPSAPQPFADLRRAHLVTLGFAETATPRGDELKGAYRKAAMRWHPDRPHNQSNPEKATEMFQKAKASYDFLIGSK